jgi:S1-C subfamily serine protease
MRLISTINDGTIWATFDMSFTCTLPESGRTLSWQAKNNEFSSRTYARLFATELKAAGFVPASDPDNLFQTSADADLRIAGNIKAIDAKLCLFGLILKSPDDHSQPDPDSASGSMIFDIDWQVFSSAQGKVILDKPVRAGATLPKHAQGNFGRLIQEGIRENIRSLIASDEFRKVLLDAPSKPVLATVDHTPIVLTASLAAKAAKISDAVGSVVLIQSAGGHGSGFLVSSDGYVMTAEHVVGSDKYVKIRWSDGLDGVGEVIRTDKRRDVAIVKTDPRGRQPLGLHRAAPEPGDTVFAIGAPLDVKNQGTVTRGVASANRIMDGFNFIQSDVTINGGNSGGPLLNERGEVLGIADLSLRERGDVPTGINYFVPIDDALRFLSAEPR